MAKDHRDENGRFLQGCPGGPGRPKRTTELQYLAVISEAVSLDDWKQIITKAVSQAKRGNRYARHFLAKYLLPADMTLSDIAAHEEVSGDLDGAVLDQLDDAAADLRWRYRERLNRRRHLATMEALLHPNGEDLLDDEDHDE